MSRADRFVLGVLAVDAGVLAVVELLYLPAYLGTTQFPITSAVAAVSMPLLVLIAGRVAGRVELAAVPLIAWFLTLVVFGTTGPGGDVLIPADDWRPLLLIGAGLVSGVAALWVLRRRDVRSEYANDRS